jgi:Fungal specific transcription factor domain
MPFFLSQYRKRVFAKAYYTDKFIATILDRPPRLLKRYSDTTWPLDLGDTKILASAEELEEACQSLTEEGWNRPGTFCASTWARLRYIIAQMLEQILEYNFQPLTTENAAKLR